MLYLTVKTEDRVVQSLEGQLYGIETEKQVLCGPSISATNDDSRQIKLMGEVKYEYGGSKNNVI